MRNYEKIIWTATNQALSACFSNRTACYSLFMLVLHMFLFSGSVSGGQGGKQPSNLTLPQPSPPTEPGHPQCAWPHPKLNGERRLCRWVGVDAWTPVVGNPWAMVVSSDHFSYFASANYNGFSKRTKLRITKAISWKNKKYLIIFCWRWCILAGLERFAFLDHSKHWCSQQKVTLQS